MRIVDKNGPRQLKLMAWKLGSLPYYAPPAYADNRTVFDSFHQGAALGNIVAVGVVKTLAGKPAFRVGFLAGP